MPTLELLVGPIASGKSSYARRRADEGALVVCHDDLTEMLHARYRYEQGKRDLYRQMEDALAERALAWGHHVVIDRTHLTREARRRWLDFAAIVRDNLRLDLTFKGIRVVAVRFPVQPAEIHARRRYAHDPRGRSYQEWLFVAEHHAGQIAAEPLSADEGFAEIREVDHA